MMLALLNSASALIILVWLMCGVAMNVATLRDRQWLRTVFFELRPLYLPAVAVSYLIDALADGQPVGAWRIIALGIQVLTWFIYKDKGGDDDRWKRRGRKAADRIRRVGTRLVVVPQASS